MSLSIKQSNTCLNCLYIRGVPHLDDHLYCSKHDSVVRYAALHTCDNFNSDNKTCDEE
jgi:hypothetical protein